MSNVKKPSRDIGTIGYIDDQLYIVTQRGLEPLTDYEAEVLDAITNIPCRLAKFEGRKKSKRKGETL